MGRTSYAIALGSNRRHGRHGAPERVVTAAIAEIAADAVVEAVSPILRTAALGPAGRAFANAVIIVSSDAAPDALLARLKAIERSFGRRAGRRWGPRVIDLDIVLWSGGTWRSPGLAIPHAEFRRRAFVLDPLARVAAGWRDPVTGLTVAQLRARFRRG
ncbi:MAG: 2-amino-4-hydroxy-6-hydroxymethyldihydropteridine diphosphokinase [Sphingomonas sp. SCN 67-18]|uniref:2-amino-4-hydroxy-6- hydroxymethyldihydropteridine diphosphokinase n=1 Tax=uncultured Sphingomonas sp. TaxID=158754 RepID=UPI0008697B5E|nr:2-amino-4-hydroxy-6-hydroxymethyldihydropteridine diphosphokinase [Sphingomonas sp. SCN 67-18]ODU22903.1 MAG: 2-amino-4-hydroxy-6-hydroxymethyldihydropteridine diphosphokinase [Sphingomonas sp. SCN 67-18]